MYINVNDYKINYIEEGSGEVVILLHGWGANLHSFDGIINLLKSKYKVYAIDLPGFGESDVLKRSFEVSDYADIVAEFYKQVISDKQKVILIGHSYGGRIIIKLNARNNLPFTIDKNILIDAAGIKDRKDLKTKIKIYTFKTLKKLTYLLPISSEYKKQLEFKLKKKFGSSDYASVSKVMQETLVKSVNEDLSDYLKNMKETLLIWGDKDTATPLWMAKKMEKEIKNSGLVVLSGGHFSYIDDPVKFSRVLISYLKL